MPLYTISVLGFAMFDMDTGDAAARYNFLATCLIAAMAMLYVSLRASLVPRYSYRKLMGCFLSVCIPAQTDESHSWRQVCCRNLDGGALYQVIGSSLPKTDFLTKIDKIVVLSIGTLVLQGLMTKVSKTVHIRSGQQAADELDMIFFVSLLVM